MCRRIKPIPLDELQSILRDVEANVKKWEDVDAPAGHEDACPESLVPVLRTGQEHLEIEVMSWGFPRSWGDGKVIFNTRGDTATDNTKDFNMWREPLAHHRCVVPTYGFYEPHLTETVPSPKTGKLIKRQYRFTVPGGPICLIAGVFEVVPKQNGASGHFSLMTTEPNRWIREVHDRMPVVLLPHEIEQWLSGDYLSLLNRESIELVKEAEQHTQKQTSLFDL